MEELRAGVLSSVEESGGAGPPVSVGVTLVRDLETASALLLHRGHMSCDVPSFLCKVSLGPSCVNQSTDLNYGLQPASMIH